MGLDIIRWLNVVGVSHLVSCVMTKVNTVMQRSRDAMDSVMNGSRNGVDSVMNRGRDGMDSVNRGGGDRLIVHVGGGASVERGVNYWHRMSWFIHRWGHRCGLLSYVLVDRGWLGFCYIRTGLRMMDAVMDRWLTGIFCRGRMGISVTISMMGGGGVVAVLGVVDSGLYGGGMASLYHLVADLEALDLGQLRGQHNQEEV